jgi:predicted Mrr-cat superfamily restriction endonuclease
MERNLVPHNVNYRTRCSQNERDSWEIQAAAALEDTDNHLYSVKWQGQVISREDLDDVIRAGLSSIEGITSVRALSNTAAFEDCKGTKWCDGNGSGGSTLWVGNLDVRGTTRLDVTLTLRHNDGQEEKRVVTLQLDRNDKVLGIVNTQTSTEILQKYCNDLRFIMS